MADLLVARGVPNVCVNASGDIACRGIQSPGELWTVGITNDDLVGAQCGAVIGLSPRDDRWLSGKNMAGVWFETIEDSAGHQAAMDCVPFGNFEAMAVSPLTSGRLDPPDICLIYATPGQMIKGRNADDAAANYHDRRQGG